MPLRRKPPADQTDRLPVRYYPRRVGRRQFPLPLSPSQALHLASDPARAARARRTGHSRHYVAAPAPRGGRLRAWWRRSRR